MLPDQECIDRIGNQFFKDDVTVRADLGILQTSTNVERHFYPSEVACWAEIPGGAFPWKSRRFPMGPASDVAKPWSSLDGRGAVASTMPKADAPRVSYGPGALSAVPAEMRSGWARSLLYRCKGSREDGTRGHGRGARTPGRWALRTGTAPRKSSSRSRMGARTEYSAFSRNFERLA